MYLEVSKSQKHILADLKCIEWVLKRLSRAHSIISEFLVFDYLNTSRTSPFFKILVIVPYYNLDLMFLIFLYILCWLKFKVFGYFKADTGTG